MVSYEVSDIEGNRTYPMGEDATGFIMYHPEGYMSAQMMSAGRPKYASGALHTGTQEEMAPQQKVILLMLVHTKSMKQTKL